MKITAYYDIPGIPDDADHEEWVHYVYEDNSGWIGLDNVGKLSHKNRALAITDAIVGKRNNTTAKMCKIETATIVVTKIHKESPITYIW